MQTRRRMLPLLVILALLPTTSWGQTRPQLPGFQSNAAAASRRLPHNLSPKSLDTAWSPPLGKTVQANHASNVTQQAESVTNAKSPGSLAAALGLPVKTNQMQSDASLWGDGTVVSQPVLPIPSSEPIASPVLQGTGAVAQVQHTAPFHDFTQLSTCGHCRGQACDGSCGGACGADCGSGLSFGPEWIPGFAVDHLSIRGGVHGFKNSGNRGQDGSFGFQEGFNFGTFARNIILPPTVGLQFGLQAMQSNMEGSGFTTQERNQTFMTLGAFRRASYGLQGGLVVDYLWDDWYFDLNVAQLRGEISMAINHGNSYGFWFATNIKDDTGQSLVNGVSTTETWETVDIYALFFRTSGLGGGRGEGRLYAGMTNDSDGVLGADTRMPLTNGWALESEFAYIIPNEPRGDGGNENEAWNLGINLVWYPGSLAGGQCLSQHRPLFDVANNGSLILRQKP